MTLEDAERAHRQRLEVVRGEVARHRRIRVAGLLGILALLVVVGPLLSAIDGLAISGWRRARLAGSEDAVVPPGPILSIAVEGGGRRLVVTGADGRTATFPIVPPRQPVHGSTRVARASAYVLVLDNGFPCIERGSAGVLRLLGRPRLDDADAGVCLRVDGDVFDALAVRTRRDTRVVFD